MTEHDHRRAALARVAGSAPRVDVEAAFARGFTAGWAQAVDWCAGHAYSAGHDDGEADGYEAGWDAGTLEARESNDSLYRAAYLDACSDHEALIAKLKARIAELEAQR